VGLVSIRSHRTLRSRPGEGRLWPGKGATEQQGIDPLILLISVKSLGEQRPAFAKFDFHRRSRRAQIASRGCALTPVERRGFRRLYRNRWDQPSQTMIDQYPDPHSSKIYNALCLTLSDRTDQACTERRSCRNTVEVWIGLVSRRRNGICSRAWPTPKGLHC
jgi:hypothetical protein